ncbi:MULTISPECIES: M2 family metallopeptidase [Xanthomonas translucens group]|uniref:M2 family metallopeptidase n=1 Tax=Xanthomonas translucens group TaxID=3390202 RepID=UPI000578FC36|nr:M2 family metallopeptidase [Xanthomonas translucens]UKE46283.1 M2 family metallopeptidase [Xanthomonas translucens pv. cerealis]UKE68576.1 M2 family metallopeptidase [Xanthomonas translucens pv. pistacia]
MNHRPLLLALYIGASVLALSACRKEASTETGTAPPPAAPGESADQFVARINEEYRALLPELTSAQWLSITYINGDSERLVSKANARWLTTLNGWIAQAKRYEGKPMSADSARALQLLKLMTAMPAPRDPAKLAELATLASKMEGAYGAAAYCSGEGDAHRCRQLGELEDVLRRSRDYGQQLDAWQGWHGTAQPLRQDYRRFVELVNEGAREMGYADTGAMWRSGYDMPPAQIAAETDRLWAQVKPLYEQLHCYTRGKLDAEYGKDKGEVAGGLLPAHLLGNMWQQDWSNLWDLLQPYPGAGSLDITDTLEKQYQSNLGAALARRNGDTSPEARFMAQRDAQLQSAKQMTERAQDFYTSLAMPKLPDSYWARSQFIKPLERNVVCHASAWDMDMAGDVRTKMCIQPNEEDFTTIYHELGHLYYDLAYNPLPPLFQGGANDGFHEAIGDTIVLAMTPHYLHSIGLVEAPQRSREALINAQMRMALSKVAFLPFGLMIDRWRWGVFDGSIAPEHYNQAWWELKARYQGVAPPTPRGEDFFDPGAKYHVPGNTPYTRYFLSHILQFQFYKGLCDAAGYNGPLYECSFYGNKEAGQKFWSMLQRGGSQPWQQTLKELTGNDKLDAAPLLEYFAPMQEWLKQQNQGQMCGWQAAKAVQAGAAAAPATPAPKPQ